MDLQGTPIGSSQQGVKHTTDPERFENPKEERPGPIASDSLAADSSRSGGAFGQNRDSEPLSVKGGNSTLANTDTSGARTLPPAPNATARDNTWNESGGGERYPEGVGGQGEFPGSHAGGSYAGGPTSAKENLASGTKGNSYNTSGSGSAFSDSGSGGPNADKISSSAGQSYSSAAGSDTGSSNSGTAPGYVSNVTQPFGQGKPKGKNITEGGFEGEANSNPDIGSEEDPGRRAEGDFQRTTQSASGATGPRQGAQSGDTPYSALSSDQRA